jgi:hypothetical protein
MHRHLIAVNKVCAPLKRNNNQEINIDVLLNFSAINFTYFGDLTDEEFEDLMLLYSIIVRNCTQKSFDEYYFSNPENLKEKIKLIVSRFDYKTQELIDDLLFVENLTDDESKLKALNRVDDVLYYYFGILRFFMHFVPELNLKTEVIFDRDSEHPQITTKDRSQDTRRSEKAPTNNIRIQSLKILCPELWKKLANSSKETQKQVIHHITGVNLEDSYKLSFGSRQTDLPEEKVAELIQLTSNLSKN